MNILTKLSVKRVLKQKFIYVFFVCFFVASFFYAFLISSPEMEEALNINIALVGGGKFSRVYAPILYWNSWNFIYIISCSIICM